MTDAGPPAGELHARAGAALMLREPAAKCTAASALLSDWRSGALHPGDSAAPDAVADPGRPSRPVLVAPSALARRGSGSPRGRLVLAHALAHIEFNAINLALDAAYRFRGLPAAFYADWLLVAAEEAQHFALLRDYLAARGCAYGDFPAHAGLWDSACATAGDVLARMALVPRVLEARGLDVTPALIERLTRAGDGDLVAVLERIYADEIGHVRIGNHWFNWLCRQRGCEPRATFRRLVREFHAGTLRGPFNTAARLAAGFSRAELADLVRLGEARPDAGPD